MSGGTLLPGSFPRGPYPDRTQTPFTGNMFTVGGTGPFGQEKGYHAPNPLDAFFGPGLLAPKHINPNNRATETVDLSQSFDGPNPYITRVIIRQMTESDVFWTRYLLPWKAFVNANSIAWNTITFNDEKVDRRPDEAVSRLVSSQRASYAAPLISIGKAFRVEANFARTPAGRMYMAMHLKQIANAAQEHANFDVARQIVMCNGKPPQAGELVSQPEDIREAMRRVDTERRLFGCFHRPNGVAMALDTARQELQRRGEGEPDYVVLPAGGLKQAQDAQRYSEDGVRSVTLGGVRTFESRPFVFEKHMPTPDPFKADREIGSFCFMDASRVAHIMRKGSTAAAREQYDPRMQSIRTWSEDANNFVTISLEQAAQANPVYGGKLYVPVGAETPAFNHFIKPQVSVGGRRDETHDETRDEGGIHYWNTLVGAALVPYLNALFGDPAVEAYINASGDEGAKTALQSFNQNSQKNPDPNRHPMSAPAGAFVSGHSGHAHSHHHHGSKKKHRKSHEQEPPMTGADFVGPAHVKDNFGGYLNATENQAASVIGVTLAAFFLKSTGVPVPSKSGSDLVETLARLVEAAIRAIQENEAKWPATIGEQLVTALGKRSQVLGAEVQAAAVKMVDGNTPIADAQKLAEKFDEFANAAKAKRGDQTGYSFTGQDAGAALNDISAALTELVGKTIRWGSGGPRQQEEKRGAPDDGKQKGAGFVSIRWNLPLICARVGLPCPASFLLFIPHQRFRMGSMVAMKSGAGFTAHGHEMFRQSINIKTYIINGHWIGRVKAIVTDPDRIVTIRNVMIDRYLGGLNTQRFFTARDKQAYTMNGSTNGKSVFACMIRPDWKPKDDVLSLIGTTSPAYPNNPDSPTGWWPRFRAYADFWGWKRERDPYKINHHQVERRPHNTICYRFAQAEFTSNGSSTGDYGDMTVNTGHLGTDLYPGSANVRSGRETHYKQISYDMTK